MATGSFSSSFLLLFPFLIALTSIISAHAASAPEEVHDITGKIVRSGLNYYILPVSHVRCIRADRCPGTAGGLTLGRNMNHSCPLNVVQEQHRMNNGLPLTFHPVNSKKAVVRVSTDLNIKFSSAPIMNCAQTTLWKLATYDAEVKQYFVTTGGQLGNPSLRTLNSWFKIEKFGNDYKLSYCPSVCRFCKFICKDIGIYEDDNGVRRLALSDVPFKVGFKKV